ncbi:MULTISPECIES: RICIN domain-containing protein [Amycolatopsis]|uniref:RICIN domain-containing protein n=1 Tax=Amycolatopsis albidoflavus TaxID=102226 RepID=A0ABW5HW33_9PSEU
MSWKVTAGLSDPSCFSFESAAHPNAYLHWTPQPGDRRAHPDVVPTARTDQFRQESTWCVQGLEGPTLALRPATTPSAYLWVPGVWDRGAREGYNPIPLAFWYVEAPQAPTPFERRYNADPALRASLGKPLADPVFGENNTGYRSYENGRLVLTRRDGVASVAAVSVEVHKKYAALNYERGPLGNPVGDAVGFGSNRGDLLQRFDSGTIYYAPSRGAMAVYGDIARKYAELGSETGLYGSPVSDTAATSDGKGHYVDFSGDGSIYWSPATGAHAVHGAIRGKWLGLGAEKSFLGFPTTDELLLPLGRRSNFVGGRIDFSSEAAVGVAYSVQPLTAAAVEFRGVHSGRCIQIAGLGDDALADLAAAELWDCYATAPKQIWDVVDLGGNTYAFKNRNSGKCLDLYNGDVGNGVNIGQYTCHYGAPQRWEITTAPGGAVALRSVASAKIVEAADSQTANGGRVQQWLDVVAPNQQWTIVPV